MKIGITCYPTYGGSGVVATELGLELAARGHDIHFISYAVPVRMTAASDRIHFHEVEVMNYPLFDHPPYTLALATKMHNVALAEGLDLLHVHYAIPHSVSAYLARAMLKPRRVPFVTTLHGTDITLVGSDRSYLPITKFSIEESDAVTAISEYLRKITVEEFAIRRPVEMIPNFVNCDVFQPADGECRREDFARDDEKILAHLSNFRPVKRVEDVVEIFARVRREIPAKLMMIGDGPDRASAEWLAREKNLTRDVIFLGKQNQVQDLLNCADVMLLPSELESFGLAALEAMACGVPAVCSRVGGIPEVMTDGVEGYLAAPHDVETMAARALDILTQPGRRETMGRAARTRAQSQFCSDKIIPLYEDLYRRVLDGSEAGSEKLEVSSER
ncbi:MAG TPA: N-acetyl-alpha-D-glucosaminyl L-malate synthase BshA [Terriglobia bacterium]|nr:N-acetyl-alpha-D-glucosaminyl L-malate synthase BshA [Terriglobia bacterium]